MSLQIRVPFTGRIMRLDEVPDPVFAQGMVGAGLALMPADDAATIEVVAPWPARCSRPCRTRSH